MTMTEKFKKKYIPGFDCRLSTFRNCLALNDIVLSNSMILGLAGSLIFCYNDGKIYSRLPHFVVAGINDQSLEGLAFNMNIYLIRGRMLGIEDFRSKIPQFLNMGLPINVAINRGLLQEILGLNSHQINMGFHYVTITDYDTKKRKITIFETDSAKPIVITEEQLETIWFSDLKSTRDYIDPLQLVDGQWYAFFCNKKLTNDKLISACYQGIEKVIINFFHSPVDFIFGYQALLNFQQMVYTLVEDQNSIDRLKDSILLMNAMESGMSGGGLGRKLYGYFLSDFSSLIGCDDLKIIASEFSKLGNKWKSFVKDISYTAINQKDTRSFSQSLKLQIDQIVSDEIVCMEELRLWLKKNWGYVD
ncbi:DUF4872 domain-containing protein [Maribacter huludaoensis]|uniref:DUF4872 domain-containing protein n=1 Tax=Maribacter huludaoensis TaxID=3030010 RepID=UPI0030B8144B